MEENNWQQRTELLLGEEKMKRIRASHVWSSGWEAWGRMLPKCFCRAGVGRMTIVDADTVQPTNMNRQPSCHALHPGDAESGSVGGTLQRHQSGY